MPSFISAAIEPQRHELGMSGTTVVTRRSSWPDGITDRHLECLAWVQEGKSASDIGVILGLSHRTIEWHLMNVCRMFGVRTRIQAVIKARDLGMLKGPEDP